MGRKRREPKSFHNGLQDQLEPLEILNIEAIQDFDMLLKQMSRTAFTGRTLGEAADVLEEMVSDQECLIVGTFSGAMTVAKMGLLVCYMIDWGWIDIVVSTGAMMAHGFVEDTGKFHFKHNGCFTDEELFNKGYDRIYDTLELEKNLDDTGLILNDILKKGMESGQIIASETICRALGKWLAEHTDRPGVLRNAYLKGVPVYIPAFTDSALGLDMASMMFEQAIQSEPSLSSDEALTLISLNYNPFLDLGSYTRRILHAKKTGIFTIGGGVPRNWAQQIDPYISILQMRTNREMPIKKFHYGIRICPEPAHWGGLSGCTYSEGISWGKFISPDDGGRFSEVLCDATVAWPLLIKAVKERLEKRGIPVTKG